ncbi:MAG: deoxyribose-phosphate aldolase [Actinobacteria bacterium]|nr:deoxyribose-phosphate aldolase [Actinomycetota bacterium]MCB8996335.1 deoxyribose-phosphate aldolase [Actinomycetota bacterium]MCB9414855.1 deoxyribose-phosphate aldolase [Actinomycetota bacterium]
MITPLEMARMVDHTLLKPEATTADVEVLCRQAVDLGVYSVCVSPSFLPLSGELLGAVKVATVCGFPSGKHKDGIKATEAARSVTDKADEVDMVIDIGNVIAGDWNAVQADVRAVREAIPATVLKVIIESAALSDLQIMEVCRVCADLGADYVKTSTGFHPSGGASAHAVELMRRTVGDALGVKASGGIRTWEAAVDMVNAGASRLGLSGTAEVLAGGTATGDY